jgi:hypothetical protein
MLLTLSSTSHVICDLAFLNAYNSKISETKNYENCVPGQVFSLYFLLQDFPPTMMLFYTYSAKSTENPKIQVI